MFHFTWHSRITTYNLYGNNLENAKVLNYCEEFFHGKKRVRGIRYSLSDSSKLQLFWIFWNQLFKTYSCGKSSYGCGRELARQILQYSSRLFHVSVSFEVLDRIFFCTRRPSLLTYVLYAIRYGIHKAWKWKRLAWWQLQLCSTNHREIKALGILEMIKTYGPRELDWNNICIIRQSTCLPL